MGKRGPACVEFTGHNGLERRYGSLKGRAAVHSLGVTESLGAGGARLMEGPGQPEVFQKKKKKRLNEWFLGLFCRQVCGCT